MSEEIEYIQKSRPWEKEAPRVRLAEQLPLDGPLSLQIDPSNLCNFRCTFCPTGHPTLLKDVRQSKGKVLSWELYEKLISEIQEFPKQLKTLSLHKDGEPLVNQKIVEMVALAKEKDVARKVVMLSNVSLLTREKAEALVAAGLDVIRISVEHVDAEGYKKFTQTFSDYRKIVENVGMLREARDRQGSKMFIAAKLIDFGLSPEQLAVFSNDFGPICDEIGRTTAQGWSYSEVFDFTLGTKPTVALDGITPLKPQRQTCAYPFYTMAVNANGIVSPCSDDWSHKAAIGDANSETLSEIWNGARMKAFRLMHLEGRRAENPACRNCACIQGLPEDSDLEQDRERLIQIYRQ